MSLKYQYVTDGIELDKAMDICRNADALALDTEFVRTKTYYPGLGLLQVSDGEYCFLFDPLVLDLKIFSEILLNKNITKVLHSCSEDLEVFQHAFGVLPRPIYDTQISSSFLGLGFSVSYQTLVEHYLSLRIEKDQTRSDWLARPLSKKQLHYAAQDVVYLYEVYKIQQSALIETHKAEWIMSDLEKISFDIPTITPAEDYYLKIGNLSRFSRRQLNLLKLLFAWREKKARTRNRPRNRIIEQKILVNIVKERSVDDAGFLRAGLPNSQVEKYSSQLKYLVSLNDSFNEHELPPEILRDNFKIDNKKVRILQGIVEDRANEEGIASELLCRKKSLQALLRSKEVSGEHHLPDSLLGWREKVVGSHLLAFLESEEK